MPELPKSMVCAGGWNPPHPCAYNKLLMGWLDPVTVRVPVLAEDDVVALDYDSDGRTDFLALNGRNSERGPVQLITLRERD